METMTTENLSVDVTWETLVDDPLLSVLEDMIQSLDSSSQRVLGQRRQMEFGLHFVDDQKMAELNRRHRDRPATTDVLSFPLHSNLIEEMPGEWPVVALGDIVISIPQAKRQSREHSISLPQEVAHLLSHGLLHLFGLDHKIESEAATMFDWEEQLVASIYQKCLWEK